MFIKTNILKPLCQDSEEEGTKKQTCRFSLFLLHLILHSCAAWLRPPSCKGLRSGSSVFVKTVKKNGITPDQLSETVYSAILYNRTKYTKTPERWPVIYVHNTDISEDQMAKIIKDIEEKRMTTTLNQGRDY